MFINGKKDSLPRKRKTTILSEILYGGSQRLTVQGYQFVTVALSSLSNEVKLFFSLFIGRLIKQFFHNKRINKQHRKSILSR